jgi:hypothetical protein
LSGWFVVLQLGDVEVLDEICVSVSSNPMIVCHWGAPLTSAERIGSHGGDMYEMVMMLVLVTYPFSRPQTRRMIARTKGSLIEPILSFS